LTAYGRSPFFGYVSRFLSSLTMSFAFLQIDILFSFPPFWRYPPSLSRDFGVSFSSIWFSPGLLEVRVLPTIIDFRVKPLIAFSCFSFFALLELRLPFLGEGKSTSHTSPRPPPFRSICLFSYLPCPFFPRVSFSPCTGSASFKRDLVPLRCQFFENLFSFAFDVLDKKGHSSSCASSPLIGPEAFLLLPLEI